uniref:ATP synthase subunit 8 n=1 Tax=Rhizoglyphus robini TaxID=223528 RepID=A0A344AR57_9ACAR|nr:ATP synthase subunit 8 [Rhizoglyphus robini]AWX53533.1 ATP synthase subunit 8 [Rhizoglyphus robini]
MVFFMIFVCVYSVSLYVSGFSFSYDSSLKPMKSSSSDLPW